MEFTNIIGVTHLFHIINIINFKLASNFMMIFSMELNSIMTINIVIIDIIIIVIDITIVTIVTIVIVNKDFIN